MKSIVMSKNQNDMIPPAVENAQQSDTTPRDVAHQLAAVKSQIKTAKDQRTLRYGDAPVTLVAVSKRQPDDKIDAVLAAGQRVFGENRVQEANQRWTGRRTVYSNLTLHL